MKLMRVLRSISPPVRLRLIKHLSTDLRHPTETPWKQLLRAHRERRRRECQKRRFATYLPRIPESIGLLRRQGN